MRKAILCPIISVILFCIMSFITNFVLPSDTRDIVLISMYAIFVCFNIIGLIVTNKIQKTGNLDTEQLKKMRYCKFVNVALVILQIPGIIILSIYTYYSFIA